MSDYVDPKDRDVLLRLALGTHTRRVESRFRHRITGETVTQLDLRKTQQAWWVSEERVAIETPWKPTTPVSEEGQ